MKVDFLVSKMLELNIYEVRYLGLKFKEKIMKGTGINPLKINMDWPSIKMLGIFKLLITLADGTWPPLNPNWFKQQEIMAKLGPFLGTMMPTQTVAPGAAPSGSPESSAQTKKKEEKKEAPKEPPKVEKVFCVCHSLETSI